MHLNQNEEVTVKREVEVEVKTVGKTMIKDIQEVEQDHILVLHLGADDQVLGVTIGQDLEVGLIQETGGQGLDQDPDLDLDPDPDILIGDLIHMEDQGQGHIHYQDLEAGHTVLNLGIEVGLDLDEDHIADHIQDPNQDLNLKDDTVAGKIHNFYK